MLSVSSLARTAFAFAALALSTADAPVLTETLQPSTYAQATGRVVVAGSSTPIAGARVTLSRVWSRDETPPTPARPDPQRVTDEDGRFTFERILPGEYQVRFSKVGFAPDVRLPIGDVFVGPRRVQLVAGQAIDLGDLSLERGVSIAGRVLDSSGEPVADVVVRALQPGGPQSRMSMEHPVPAGDPADTNDVGEFRLFGLPPGAYFIAASPRPLNLGARTAARTVSTMTYFPSTVDAAAASAVNVPAGGSTNGIEIRLVAVAGYHVTGVVVDGDGKGVAGATVVLMSWNMFQATGNSRTAANGTFTIDGVPSGEHRATAFVQRVQSGITVEASTKSDTRVVVADGDVSGVRLVIQAR
jgi:carboxypeptidase family protein